MPAPTRRRTVPLLLAMLCVPWIPGEPAVASAHDAEHLRLFGCADDLDADGMIGRDGALDCAGDLLHLGHAWLPSAGDPFLRKALGSRDQTITLTLRYHPTYWAPGLGTAEPGAVLVAPGDPTQGLFDLGASGPDGRFDGALVSDERVAPDADDDDSPDPVDRAPPIDGLPDLERRNDGRYDGDLYLEAVALRYDVVWTAGADEPVPLPDGASFVFPYATEQGARAGIDAWNLSGDPTPLHWAARPFGLGTTRDDLVALHTPEVKLSPGDHISFLDHQATFVGFLPQGEQTAAVFDIDYLGHAVPQRIGAAFPLVPGAPGTRDATLSDPGTSARNVLLADGLRASAGAPAPTGGPERLDDAWFLMVSSIDYDDQGKAQGVLLHAGRLISGDAPRNALFVDRALYRTSVREAADGLERFTVTRVLPLDGDYRFRHLGLDVDGLDEAEALPLLVPFSAPHQVREDLRPPLDLDASGFLRERVYANGVVSTGEVALQPGSQDPASRVRRAPALKIVWEGTAVHEELAVAWLPGGDALAASATHRAPFRSASFQLPDGRYLVESDLLRSGHVVTPAPGGAQPRAGSSWVYAPGQGPRVSVDEGVRLYGATHGDARAADVLVPASALLRAGAYAGLIRTPSAPAHEEIGVALRYVPYHVYEARGFGLLPVSDESLAPDADPDRDADPIDAAEDGDNLFDVAPRNDDPGRADVYGPAFVVRYRFALRDLGTLQPQPAPLGPDSFWLLPAADRDPLHPGLDSFDLDGDGDADPVHLAGFWAVGPGTGTARLGNGPAFAPEGGALEADLLWLRSPELEVRLGAIAQLFDVWVRFVAFDPSGGTVRLEVIDPAATGEPTRLGVVDVRLSGPRCVGLHQDGGVDVVPVACDTIEGSTGADAPSPADDRAWVELVGAGGDRVTLHLNRLVSHVPRPDVPELATFVVGGLGYRWAAIASGGGAEATIRHLDLEAVQPIGAPVMLATRTGSAQLHGLAASGVLPLVPPFGSAHEAIVDFGVGWERDAHGFIDAAAEPDADAVAGAAADRVLSVGPLLVQLERRDQERAFRYVFLDPARQWDPERRPGIAVLGGTFAEPAQGWRGVSDPGAVPVLKVGGLDGFDEALRSAADRGWDHYVSLGVSPDRGRYLVDSARLAAGAGVAVAEANVWPSFLGRPMGLWLYDPVAGGDWYVHRPGEAPVTPGPGRPDAPGPDDGPSPAGPDRGTQRDDPAPGAAALIALVLVCAWAARRRRRNG